VALCRAWSWPGRVFCWSAVLWPSTTKSRRVLWSETASLRGSADDGDHECPLLTAHAESRWAHDEAGGVTVHGFVTPYLEAVDLGGQRRAMAP
jgi:hypothetical protein